MRWDLLSRGISQLGLDRGGLASAHKTYWLNPESRSDWDTGDSLASGYASCIIDDMDEVRTLRQLERFIGLRL